jgi:hypothetical protein
MLKATVARNIGSEVLGLPFGRNTVAGHVVFAAVVQPTVVGGSDLGQLEGR